jgi:hypothetical protein
MTHEHSLLQWATFHHAPVGEPPLHTTCMVLVCDCGVYEVFPERNYELTTPAFQTVLRGLMTLNGYHPIGLIDEARELVAAGGTHDCGEWRTARHRCAVCDRDLAF